MSVSTSLKSARSTTSGLLSSYPLGLLVSMIFVEGMMFFIPMPDKGIYGGEAILEKPNVFFFAFVAVSFMATWMITVHHASKGQLWPKRSSFLFGLMYGACAGIVAPFLTIVLLIPILIFIGFFLEMIIGHPIPSITCLLILWFFSRKAKRRGRSPTK